MKKVSLFLVLISSYGNASENTTYLTPEHQVVPAANYVAADLLAENQLHQFQQVNTGENSVQPINDENQNPQNQEMHGVGFNLLGDIEQEALVHEADQAHQDAQNRARSWTTPSRLVALYNQIIARVQGELPEHNIQGKRLNLDDFEDNTKGKKRKRNNR